MLENSDEDRIPQESRNSSERNMIANTSLEIACKIFKTLSNNAYLLFRIQVNCRIRFIVFFNTPYVGVIFRKGLSIDKVRLNNMHTWKG